MSKLQLITRADDAGSCRSANEAILEGVEAGIIKNVSFLVVGPEIEHAVEILGGRNDIAYGFHVCFNAEWEDVKWGPLRQSGVFVDSKGNFLPFPNDTKSQAEQIQAGEATWSDGGVRFQFDIVDYQIELIDEIRAQFERLRKLGLQISYVDEHMGISQIGFGIREGIVNLCSDENLVDYFGVPSLPHVDVQGDEITQFESRLKAASLGLDNSPRKRPARYAGIQFGRASQRRRRQRTRRGAAITHRSASARAIQKMESESSPL